MAKGTLADDGLPDSVRTLERLSAENEALKRENARLRAAQGGTTKAPPPKKPAPATPNNAPPPPPLAVPWYAREL